jgi:putative ABC transport system permease protein
LDIAIISVPRLALSFIPVAIVVVLMWRWGQGYTRQLQAIARMLLQLSLIGYVLVYIFQAESGLIISAVLTLMLCAASWIALNTVDLPKGTLFPASLVSVVLGGGSTLALITQGVLQLDPWYQPSVIIPLAGMIFAGSMTNISLALERLHAEMQNGRSFDESRDIALRTSMIPIINSFFAVGLISLPGMMTGQIMSGVSPLIAVRYQIMVMCMLFGAAGLSTVCFLTLIRSHEYFARAPDQ